MERHIKTLTGERIPIEIRNPKKDLSENEFKLYNLIKYNPLTLLEIRKKLYRIPVKGLEDVSDPERMLRRLRDKKYAIAVPQRKGNQKWKTLR